MTREGMVGLTEQMGHFQLSPRALALWLVTLPTPCVFLSHAEWLGLDTEVVDSKVASLLFLDAWF